MRTSIIALLAGIIFGAGLSLAQMINPDKVQNFLDIAGNWDPSLLFVMIGALAVPMATFRFILKRPAPVWAGSFELPKKRSVDLKLIAGAAIFGTGWGISGYCPGPSVTGLGIFSFESVVMAGAICLGFTAYRFSMREK